jgi:hypothetical protein
VCTPTLRLAEILILATLKLLAGVQQTATRACALQGVRVHMYQCWEQLQAGASSTVSRRRGESSDAPSGDLWTAPMPDKTDRAVKAGEGCSCTVDHGWVTRWC